MADLIQTSLLILLACIYGAFAELGEYCYTEDQNNLWCEYGCCDDRYHYKKCCHMVLSTGLIVGIVLGCLFFIALLAGIIVCICCIVRKQRGQQGHVMAQPGTSSAHVQYGAQPAGYGGQQTYPMSNKPQYGRPPSYDSATQ